MTMTRPAVIALLVSASETLQQAHRASLDLGDPDHARRCRAIAVDVLRLIGEIATEAPREERTVS